MGLYGGGITCEKLRVRFAQGLAISRSHTSEVIPRPCRFLNLPTGCTPIVLLARGGQRIALTLHDARRRGSDRIKRRRRRKSTIVWSMDCSPNGHLNYFKKARGRQCPLLSALQCHRGVIEHAGHIHLSLTFLMDGKIKHAWPRSHVANC